MWDMGRGKRHRGGQRRHADREEGGAPDATHASGVPHIARQGQGRVNRDDRDGDRADTVP